MGVWSSSLLSEEVVEGVGGERTHCTESRRWLLDVNGVPAIPNASFVGDIVLRAIRVGVMVGRSVPFMLASARGSIDLRRR